MTSGRGPLLGGALAAITVCLLWVSASHWRQGLLGFAMVIGVTAALRLVLPVRTVGLLAVRGRAFDVAMLLALAVAIGGLTLAVPTPTG